MMTSRCPPFLRKFVGSSPVWSGVRMDRYEIRVKDACCFEPLAIATMALTPALSQRTGRGCAHVETMCSMVCQSRW